MTTTSGTSSVVQAEAGKLNSGGAATTDSSTSGQKNGRGGKGRMSPLAVFITAIGLTCGIGLAALLVARVRFAKSNFPLEPNFSTVDMEEGGPILVQPVQVQPRGDFV